jgi:glycosyltransferase involved in cell wall biosynthesis
MKPKMMRKILLLEPYFTGSHASWALGFQRSSRHQVDILSLKGQFWKWRMHGGAVTLARQFNESDNTPDLIIATDMLDLTIFLALTRQRTSGIPVALYFHENQLAYPWSPEDRDIAQKRDQHYGFINYASSLAADAIYFNSAFNRDSFIRGLRPFLKHFPDYNELATIEDIASKSSVLPLGLDLARFDIAKQCKADGPPIILWNHRWEFDKNPSDFFKAINVLDDEGLGFRLVLLGENFRKVPAEFLAAKDRYGDRILHYGYAESQEEYAHWLWRSHILPVVSHHDFFGISVVEAVYCGCLPLLPKRLAYLEIVPKDLHATFFYTDFDDLLQRLREHVLNYDGRKVSPLQEEVDNYRWEKMSLVYDETMETILKS